MSAGWVVAERADVCAVAIAEAFRGDGEVFASGMGTLPMLGARLAHATFEPELLVSDGEAFYVAGDLPLGSDDKVVEGWIPFRSVFDTLWAGRRHVVMGASQLDAEGNQNISNIGPWAKPAAQLLGVRGAPGNTVNHTTSYWVPNHSTRVFVPQVDVVCGLGYRRAAAAGAWVAAHHEIRRVVTNKAVLDFNGPGHRCRLVSVHPGVTVDDVVAATGFELLTDDVATSREPTPEESAALDRLDPAGLRLKEVRP
ncbi:MAG TPA: CoA-transferase [Acidimicrobiales bacterium]|nr:CoA-transferase [Acidimicrobiales bacterium]